jgi:hypothetical protein
MNGTHHITDLNRKKRKKKKIKGMVFARTKWNETIN